MKKAFLFAAMLLPPLLSSAEFDDPGLISGWSFAPLQIDVGWEGGRSTRLVDKSSHTALAFGLLTLQQESSVLSTATIANTIVRNHGIQTAILPVGCASMENCGISLGAVNLCKRNRGILIGVLCGSFRAWQLCGVSIADKIRIGLFTRERAPDSGGASWLHVGVVNCGSGAFQIGLVNYNPNSYLPWLPILNFDMGRELPPSPAPRPDR